MDYKKLVDSLTPKENKLKNILYAFAPSIIIDSNISSGKSEKNVLIINTYLGKCMNYQLNVEILN